MWSRALSFPREEGTRALLGWIGSGLVVLIAGLWAAFVYFFPPKKDDSGGAIKVEANCGSAAAEGTMTQMNLGNVLETFGERESGTARLEEARSLAGKNPRAGAARMGQDPEQSRQCAQGARHAGERDGAAG